MLHPPEVNTLTAQLYVYPIKGIRAIPLKKATLTPQGIQHDRRFMLCQVTDSGDLKKMQLSAFTQCSLFTQEIVDDIIHVKYNTPAERLVPEDDLQMETLQVPLEPDTEELQRTDMNLHNSWVTCWVVGDRYDAWFSACFGFPVTLLYIGDERRPVLGTFSPRNPPPKNNEPKGWLSSMSSYLRKEEPEPDWLTFSDMAPFLITSETSLDNVSARLSSGNVDMIKFRPNVVVSGEDAFAEDYWSRLSLNGQKAFILTKLCNRCTSLNVDYETGKTAEGEAGTVLKKLMSDRRVDEGYKNSPSFGRYGFLDNEITTMDINVNDDVEVTERKEDRPVFDWPIRKALPVPQFYRY